MAPPGTAVTTALQVAATSRKQRWQANSVIFDSRKLKLDPQTQNGIRGCRCYVPDQLHPNPDSAADYALAIVARRARIFSIFSFRVAAVKGLTM
jgi:hypothetical protein